MATTPTVCNLADADEGGDDDESAGGAKATAARRPKKARITNKAQSTDNAAADAAEDGPGASGGSGDVSASPTQRGGKAGATRSAKRAQAVRARAQQRGCPHRRDGSVSPASVSDAFLMAGGGW